MAGPWNAAAARTGPTVRMYDMGGIGMLILGVLTAIPVSFVGRLYIGEVLLGLVGPVAIPLVVTMPGRYGKLARTLLIAMIISWIGYIGSDLYRGTPGFDYLRGWFRWVALISSYATLAWLGSKNVRYAVFFLIGWCLGTAFYPLFLANLPIRVWWKFYAGFPTILILAYFAGKFGPTIAAATMGAVGALSILLDSRSMMMTCLVTAGLSLIAGRRKPDARRSERRLSKSSVVVAVLAIGVCGAASLFIVEQIGIRYGYADRFERSNVRRWTNVEIAYEILKQSPLIGYGSWARDPEVARIRDKIVAKQVGKVTRSEAQDDLIIVHSQILQAWVEGGLIGLAFFVIYGWHLAEKGMRLAAVLPYEPLTPLIIFVLITAAWHFFASPFSGTSRVIISVACVLMCYLETGGTTARVAAPALAPAAPWRRSMAAMPRA